MNDITLTFGKHNGKKLSEIPRDYVSWLSEKAFKAEVKQAAQDFLKEHPETPPAQPKRSQIPGPAPRTLQEAEKLSWMAGKGYGNAKATLLAARDPDGFLVVYDDEDDELFSRLLLVFDTGTVIDTNAYSCTRQQIENAIARYGNTIDGADLLANLEEQEKQEADEKRRSLSFKTLNGKRTIVLCVYDSDEIHVSVDGREWGSYMFRALTEEERKAPKWQGAVAVLEPDEDDPLSAMQPIGLTPERKTLIEQKIQEVAK